MGRRRRRSRARSGRRYATRWAAHWSRDRGCSASPTRSCGGPWRRAIFPTTTPAAVTTRCSATSSRSSCFATPFRTHQTPAEPRLSRHAQVLDQLLIEQAATMTRDDRVQVELPWQWEQAGEWWRLRAVLTHPRIIGSSLRPEATGVNWADTGAPSPATTTSSTRTTRFWRVTRRLPSPRTYGPGAGRDRCSSPGPRTLQGGRARAGEGSRSSSSASKSSRSSSG